MLHDSQLREAGLCIVGHLADSLDSTCPTPHYQVVTGQGSADPANVPWITQSQLSLRAPIWNKRYPRVPQNSDLWQPSWGGSKVKLPRAVTSHHLLFPPTPRLPAGLHPPWKGLVLLPDPSPQSPFLLRKVCLVPTVKQEHILRLGVNLVALLLFFSGPFKKGLGSGIYLGSAKVMGDGLHCRKGRGTEVRLVGATTLRSAVPTQEGNLGPWVSSRPLQVQQVPSPSMAAGPGYLWTYSQVCPSGTVRRALHSATPTGVLLTLDGAALGIKPGNSDLTRGPGF